MKGKLYSATLDLGKGTFVAGTEDLPTIHCTIGEGLVGLMTDPPHGKLVIYLQDDVGNVTGYSLRVDQILSRSTEMTFKLVKLL